MSIAVSIGRRLAWAIVGASLLVAPTASARPLAPVAAKKRLSFQQKIQAKKAFEAGAALYTEADYEKALEKFQEAYEISEKPLIWDSISKCHEKLGNFQDAYDALALWREDAPANEHALLDKRLEKLKERADAKRAEEEAKQRELEEAKREAEEAKRKAEEAKKAAAGEPAPPPEEDEGTDLLVPGVVVASVGGAALVTGVIVAAVGAGQRPDEAEACRDVGGRSLCRQASQDDIEGSATLTTVGDVLWIAGAVTAAVGTSLIVIDLLGEDDGAAADAGIDEARLRLGPGAFVFEGTW